MWTSRESICCCNYIISMYGVFEYAIVLLSMRAQYVSDVNNAFFSRCLSLCLSRETERHVRFVFVFLFVRAAPINLRVHLSGRKVFCCRLFAYRLHIELMYIHKHEQSCHFRDEMKLKKKKL